MAYRIESSRQRGFTLIEVLVVLGVMSVLAMGVVQMIVSMNTSITVQESRTLKTAVGEAIRMQLVNKDTCLNSFQKLPTDLSITQPQDIEINLGASASGKAADDVNLIAPKRELANYAFLYVQSLQVADLKKVGGTSTVNHFLGGIDLSLASQKFGPNQSNEVADGRFQLSKRRVASVMFDVPVAGGTPTSCYSLNADLDLSSITQTVCLASGGTFTNGACVPPKAQNTGGGCATESIPTVGPAGSYGATGNGWGDCTQDLPARVGENSVPADQRDQYNFVCPFNYPQYPTITWIPKGEPNAGATPQGECLAVTKKYPLDPAATSIPSGVTCANSNTPQGTCNRKSCVNGAWITQVNQNCWATEPYHDPSN